VPEFITIQTGDVLVPTGDATALKYTREKGDVVIGYAVKTYDNEGFCVIITLMAGSNDGSIITSLLLDHKETPAGTKNG
jgi:Na+-translocating ferredoxin:NAD+ oxidoreductase RnfG subunit